MNFPKKVLLIDDDEDEYDIFTAALNGCCKGVELIYEKNARSALVQMANDEADTVAEMVFLDWHMPQISGKDVLTSIRKLPCYTQVPIVIFTGLLDPFYLKEAKELGATFLMEKPFDLADLGQKLEYLFSLDWKQIKHTGQQI
ncbi:hypothetical protein A3860_12645 [Niastella vici]|uniref:Response regulatory domain-containing protein n=1 Tax=Niastella vici TaxID=1703345 RepID=A0A1V9G7A2_9BACT|nr:response regulator [Niastella vici]OQP66346.1 hypothetical protein A3860_12645 [Niastella vici]